MKRWLTMAVVGGGLAAAGIIGLQMARSGGCALAQAPLVSPAKAGGGVYDEFNRFCVQHFGAEKEEEVYNKYGRELKTVPEATWQHISESSACIAWETNLPAKTYVEYGPTSQYGRKTPEPERCFSLHLHYLKDLKPNTTYHYRLVAIDERGNKLTSQDMTFTTKAVPNAMRIPEDVPGPPYVLDRPDTTYLVTRDIGTDGTAIFIAASGITLDLGGRTITYDQKRDTANEGACGVRGHKTRGIGLQNVTVLNGTVARGNGGSSTQAVWETIYNPIFFSKPVNLEIAGVTVNYQGCQVAAVAWFNGGDRLEFHHNVILDEGTELFNRHVGIDMIALYPTNSKCHHNLVKRTRHRGISTGSETEIYANEIYIDSYATNSYGVIYYGDGKRNISVHDNRIFGTGYHPIGLGSAQGNSDVRVYGNYIQMQGTEAQERWRGGQGGGDPEGQLHPVNGIRLQKPGPNVEHYDNVIVSKGYGEGCMLRGLWVVPVGPTRNVSFRNNVVKVLAEDDKATGYAIAALGTDSGNVEETVTYEGNTIISNICHVQFGDNYGFGGRHVFVGDRLIKVGNDPRYKTIRLGWGGWKYESFGHLFANCVLEGGASFDSVSYDGTQVGRYDFSVGWVLTVRTSPGASVFVTDATGQRLSCGAVPQGGELVIPLAQYVQKRAGKTMLTPHTVAVEKDGKTHSVQVTLDQNRTVEVKL